MHGIDTTNIHASIPTADSLNLTSNIKKNETPATNAASVDSHALDLGKSCASTPHSVISRIMDSKA